MEKINFNIMKTETIISQILTDSELPISVAVLIVKNILNNLLKIQENVIKQEMKQLPQQTSEEETRTE